MFSTSCALPNALFIQKIRKLKEAIWIPQLAIFFFIVFLFPLDEEIRLHVRDLERGAAEGECLDKPVSLWLLCGGTRQEEEGEDF